MPIFGAGLKLREEFRLVLALGPEGGAASVLGIDAPLTLSFLPFLDVDGVSGSLEAGHDLIEPILNPPS